MVFYECIVTAKNTSHFHTLTTLLKAVSHTIVEGGGVVRGIANHGIRDLPHRHKARYADKEGNRYYRKGRLMSIYYDSNPTVRNHVDHMLSIHDQVLRNTHLKARSALDGAAIAKPDHNPYVQRILRHHREQHHHHHQQQREQAALQQHQQQHMSFNDAEGSGSSTASEST